MRPSLFTLLVLLPCLAWSKPWWLRDNQASEGDFLPPDQAFRVSARVDGELLRVRWDIADGYYLYRVKFDISAESPDLTLEPAQFPPGVSRTDAYFGTQEIFRQQVETLVGFKRSDAGAHPVQIKVSYQGCADAGLCYPLIVKVLSPEVAPRPAQTITPEAAAVHAVARPPAQSPAQREDIPVLGCLVGTVAFFLAGLTLRRNRSA